MMAMNGFTLGFFFPKQKQAATAASATEVRLDVKIVEEKPSRDVRYDLEPSTLALNAYRFF